MLLCACCFAMQKVIKVYYSQRERGRELKKRNNEDDGDADDDMRT